MSENTYIGERIQKCRMAKGLSQEALSEAVDISQSYLSKIETGSEKPGRDLIRRICEILGISTDYIYYGLPEDENPRASGFISWFIRQSPEVQELILDINEPVKRLIDKQKMADDVSVEEKQYMPNYFRKLQFQTVDGQQVDWDLSYLCDVTNGTVYTFYFDTAFSGTLTDLKMPVIDGTSLKYLTYTNYKTDIVNDVKDWIENNQSFIDAIIVNGVARTAENAEKTSFDNNSFSELSYDSSTNSFLINLSVGDFANAKSH